MTSLLDGAPRADADAITLLPGRAALLDLLALRRPTGPGPATSGLVVVGLRTATLPLGAGVLLDVAAALAGALVEGEWLARCGSAEFGVLTEQPVDLAADRLLAALPLAAAAGLCPVTAGRDAAEVLRLAQLGLTLAHAGGPGRTARYPGC